MFKRDIADYLDRCWTSDSWFGESLRADVDRLRWTTGIKELVSYLYHSGAKKVSEMSETTPPPDPYLDRQFFPSIKEEVYEALKDASAKVSERVLNLVKLPPFGGVAQGQTLNTVQVGSIEWPITDDGIEQASKLIADELIASIVVDGSKVTATARVAVVVPNADLAGGSTTTDSRLNIVTQLVL